MEDPQNLMTLDMFAPHVNEVYRIDTVGGEPLELKLVEALARPIHPTDGRYGEGTPSPVRTDPFTLIFTTPRNQFLEQGTYVLNHDALGRRAIFLVPIGRTAEEFSYQAVFN